VFLFLLLSRNYRCNALHPLGPVAIDELGHVVGLGLWVLQIQVRRLCRALVWIPVLWDPVRFSCWVQVREGHQAQRHLDASALATLKEPIVLQVDLEQVGDLEDLTHPRGANVLEYGAFLVIIIACESFLT